MSLTNRYTSDTDCKYRCLAEAGIIEKRALQPLFRMLLDNHCSATDSNNMVIVIYICKKSAYLSEYMHYYEIKLIHH